MTPEERQEARRLEVSLGELADHTTVLALPSVKGRKQVAAINKLTGRGRRTKPRHLVLRDLNAIIARRPK